MTPDEITAVRRVQTLMDEIAAHEHALGLLRAEAALTARLKADAIVRLAAARDALCEAWSRRERVH